MVRNPALLGHLLACPKCGGMVLVAAPAPSESSSETLSPETASTTATTLAPAIPPAPPVAPVAEAPPVLDRPPDVAPSETSSEPESLIRKRPKHTAEKSTRMILVSVLVSVALLLGVVYVAVLQRPKPEPPPGEQAVVSKNEPVAPVENEPIELPDPQPIAVNESENEAESEPGEEVEPDDSVAETVSTESEIVEPDATDTPLPLPIPQDQAPAIVPEPIRDRVVIDVPARLKLPLASLKSERTTLFKAISMLSDYAGVPVTWDVPGMRLFEISLDYPIRLDFDESTVGEVLTAVLSRNRLTLLIEHEQIFIYPIEAADPAIREARYDLSDLVRTTDAPAIAGDKNASLFSMDGTGSLSLLVESIPQLIAPFSWESPRGGNGGGNGSLSAEGTVLTVRQTEINHKEIARFLEMMRFVKKKSPADPPPPSETEPLRRKLFPEKVCGELLEKPLTLHYGTPTSATAVFKLLEQSTGLRILVNHRVLNEGEAPFSELKMSVHVEKGTLQEVLRQLLHSVDQLELTYRIVDCETVEVLSWDASLLPEYGTLESHYYGAKLRTEPEQTVDDMISMLKNTVEPDFWAENISGGGAIFADRDSETFFVRQSQPIQRVIRAWLKQ